MNLPNILTLLRIALAPVFFILYWMPEWFGVGRVWVFVLACLVFLVMELTDIVDGWVARKYNLVTGIGKVLDPFSDVICRLTYFLGFLATGILHPVFCLLILYREFGMVFLRMMLSQRGIALAAKTGGKLKSLVYFFAAAAALGLRGGILYGADENLLQILRAVVDILFGLSTVLAWLSLGQYLAAYAGKLKESPNGTVDSAST